MDANPQPVTIRRNAKQASCEPCRLSKVRCSHETPCSRCVRNGRPEECIVHPAPMTRRTTTSSSKTGSRASPGALLSTPTPLTLEAGGGLSYPRSPNQHLNLENIGSMGPSPLLVEPQNDFGNVWEELRVQSDLDAATDMAIPEIAPKLQRFCRGVLAWLPSRAIAKSVLSEHLENNPDATRSMLFQRQMEDFWSTYENLLEEPKTTENLTMLADQLCINTREELKIPTTNSEWLDLLSGPRTRWQVIGEIFVTLGFATYFWKGDQQKLGALIPTNMSRKEYGISMLECADSCLLLCDQLDANSNMLTAQLLLHCVILQSQLTGDTSYGLWKRCGALMHAITGLGMHRELQVNHPVAPLYDAQRSRVFARAFILDKTLATFCGRPPALNRHYVSLSLPLDLDDSEIMYGDPRYFPSQIDSSGWNKGQGMHMATQIRAEMMQNIIRDEILEFVLAKVDDASFRIQDLRSRVNQSWQNLPLYLRIPLDKSMFGGLNEWQIGCMCLLRLNHLQNLFLLERIQHQDQDQEALRGVAGEILKTVMWQWSNRGAFGNNSREAVRWSISYHGVPAASALAMYLWRQTTTPHMQQVGQYRPQVIQDLSLFLSCLDWIESSDGNFLLCMRVKKMVKYILDRILEPNMDMAGSSHYSSRFINTSMPSSDISTFAMDSTGWFPPEEGWGRGDDQYNQMSF